MVLDPRLMQDSRTGEENYSRFLSTEARKRLLMLQRRGCIGIMVVRRQPVGGAHNK